MPCTKIAIAKVNAELDIAGDDGADSGNPRDKLIARLDVNRNPFRLLPIPNHHLVADVPLQAEIAMRDRLANRTDLTKHRLLIGSFDNVDVLGAEAMHNC